MIPQCICKVGYFKSTCAYASREEITVQMDDERIKNMLEFGGEIQGAKGESVVGS